MVPYVLVLLYVIFFPMLCNVEKNKNKKIYCVTFGIMMCALYGFRSETLGMNDVEYVYLPMVNKVASMSWSELFSKYPFVRGNSLQVLTKLFTQIFPNQYLWLFLSGIPFIVATVHLVYKYSKDAQFCFFMLFGTYFYLINMFIIRNSWAIVFLIIAFERLLKNKPIHFLLFVLIATSFHTTAIVFLLAYPISKFRVKPRYYIITIICSYVVIYYSKSLFLQLFTFIQTDYYSLYSNASEVKGLMYFNRFLPLYLLLIILTFQNRKFVDFRRLVIRNSAFKSRYNSKAEYSIDEKFNNMLSLTLFFMGLESIVADFYRLGMFFAIFGIIGLSNEVAGLNGEMWKNGIKTLLFIIYSIYIYGGLYAANLAPYVTWF